MKAIIILVALAVLGLALGYIGGYVEYYNESRHGGSCTAYEFEWVEFLALPGALISQSQRDFDYQLTEAWHLDKHRMAFWNSICYAVLGIPVILCVYWKRWFAYRVEW